MTVFTSLVLLSVLVLRHSFSELNHSKSVHQATAQVQSPYSPEMPATEREITTVRMVARDLVQALQQQRPLNLPPFNYIGVASFRFRTDVNNARFFLVRLQLSPSNEEWAALLRVENGLAPVLVRVFGPLQPFQSLEEAPYGVGPYGPDAGQQGGPDGGFGGQFDGSLVVPQQGPQGFSGPPGSVPYQGPMKRENTKNQQQQQQNQQSGVKG